MKQKIELKNNETLLAVWLLFYIIFIFAIYFLFSLHIINYEFFIIFLYICIFSSISTFIAFKVMYPFKIQITENGLIFFYKYIDNEYVPWKNIIDIKTSKIYNPIIYMHNNKKKYFAPTYKNTLIIKREWEKWKTRSDENAK